MTDIAVDRLRYHGQLRRLLPRWPIPRPFDAPVPALLALLPFHLLLQPRLQHDHDHHRDQLRQQPCERHRRHRLRAERDDRRAARAVELLPRVGRVREGRHRRAHAHR